MTNHIILCVHYTEFHSNILYNRANILIDHYHNSKACEFGFAYQVPEVKSGRTLITALILARNLGYFPPKNVNGQLSVKSDVYSYGVVSRNHCF